MIVEVHLVSGLLLRLLLVELILELDSILMNFMLLVLYAMCNAVHICEDKVIVEKESKVSKGNVVKVHVHVVPD